MIHGSDGSLFSTQTAAGPQDAIKRILLRESLNQPLVIIFEDLHWIDSETQSMLNVLVDSIGTARGCCW
jgi:predicted ATPase